MYLIIAIIGVALPPNGRASAALPDLRGLTRWRAMLAGYIERQSAATGLSLKTSEVLSRHPAEVGCDRLCNGSLAGSLGRQQLFAHYPPQNIFQRLLAILNVLTQSMIDECLIVAAARRMHFFAKPIQDIIIESNRDPRLATGHRVNRATLACAEIIFVFHGLAFVLFPLMALGFPRRDNANVLAAPGEDDDQDSPQRIQPNRNKSFFIRKIVWNSEGVVI